MVVPQSDDDEGTEERPDLLEQLAQSRRSADLPGEVLQQAKAALARRQTGSQLLELVYDSFLDSDLTVETSGGPVRLLEFRGADSRVELALVGAGSRCDLVGHVDPPALRSAELRTPTVILAVDVRDNGEFAAAGVPRGPVTVRLQLSTAPKQVHTDWITV